MPYKNIAQQRAYQREWMARRRADYFHGKICVKCGDNSQLELDHIFPESKLSHCVWSWTKERREQELSKCQVLCAACHQKKSNASLLKPFMHGTNLAYSKGCRCKDCKKASALRKAKWRFRTGKH
jgi:5-methylcytosine-specific restriction endonuclease McrA